MAKPLRETPAEVRAEIRREEVLQFSFPGGIPSHVAPETPGSIHEGGELGYSLSHAFGAAFDNPGLLVACVVGDGEAETGPLAVSWHSNKFLNPVHDGAVLPILHLNGYKIAGPTVLARIPHAELAPQGERRMSANPHANGGLLLRDLRMPDFRDYAVQIARPGAADGESTRIQGRFIRDVIRLNPVSFRVFSPDETSSNRWGDVFEVTNRCSTAEIIPGDDHVAPDGRVMEMLIHRLTYRRTNHKNLHVRGFKEEGSTTTPFDMVVMNDLDRFHLAADVMDRVPALGPRAAYVKQEIRDKLIEHKQYIAEHGEDLPEIRNWKWSSPE